MQQCGTRWAYEAMQRVGRKEVGRFTIILHDAANAIVLEAVKYDCTHIAFEALSEIRKRFPWGDVASPLGVSETVCVRRVQGRFGGHQRQTGDSKEHVTAVFSDGLWIYTSRQPTGSVLGRPGRVLLSEVQLKVHVDYNTVARNASRFWLTHKSLASCKRRQITSGCQPKHEALW